jgi:predicted acylesterase/phospholipase RssA
MADEQRFALVLNGGVSLAVWMGGVIEEVNSLRMVSAQPDPQNASTRAKLSRDAWRAILETAKKTVTVDLVAGTSAGGLNGAILAHSIAMGRDLPAMREMWRDTAALTEQALMQESPADTGWALSATLLGDRIQLLLNADAEGCQLKPCPVTLLTTATAVTGDRSPGADDYREPYSYRDSRRVFRFKRSIGDGAGDFTDAYTLCLAARASASFPVAFRPVQESPALAKLRVRGEGACSLLMDGGVLDNAPFEPLLEELIRIPTGGSWQRHLLYITPGVETHAAPPASAMTWWDEIARLVPIAREPDQRLDEDALQEARASSGYSASAPHVALEEWLTTPAPPAPALLDAAVPGLFQRYRAGREQALLRLISPGTGDDVSSLLLNVVGVVPVNAGPADAVGWQWGLSVAIRVTNWWGRTLSSATASAETTLAYESLCGLQAWLVEQEQRLVTALDSAGSDCVARASALTALYADPLRAQIYAQITEMADRVTASFPSSPRTGAELIGASLRLEQLTAAFSWSSQPLDLPRICYARLTPSAESLVDHEAFAGDWPSKKLYGERWGHFGAFADRRGREHDWLWGRLDAASKLSAVLLAGRSDADSQALRQKLCEAILAEELPRGADQDARRQCLIDGAARVRTTTASDLFRSMDTRESNFWCTSQLRVLAMVEQASGLRRVAPLARALLSTNPPARENLPLRWRLTLRAARWWGRPKLESDLRRALRGKLSS